MDSTQSLSDFPTIDKMSPRELAALVEDARSLQRAAEAGAPRQLLRGRRFGLLRAAGDAGKDDDIALFERAAVELGAQVAHLRPYGTELSQPQEEHTALMLGRLYDAVICQGMAPALVQRLRTDAGIPVYDRIASQSQPIAKAAALLGHATSATDNRRFLLQALLLKTIV